MRIMHLMQIMTININVGQPEYPRASQMSGAERQSPPRAPSAARMARDLPQADALAYAASLPPRPEARRPWMLRRPLRERLRLRRRPGGGLLLPALREYRLLLAGDRDDPARVLRAAERLRGRASLPQSQGRRAGGEGRRGGGDAGLLPGGRVRGRAVLLLREAVLRVRGPAPGPQSSPAPCSRMPLLPLTLDPVAIL